MPSGIGNAYWYQAFNTLSFSLIIGSFMALYFKQLGATATILGVLGALPPLTSILQIPSAHLVEKFGYKTFVVKGWSLRSYVVLMIAVAAFLPDGISSSTRLTLILFLLFAWNTMRGISMCGFMPWMSLIIPKTLLGRHIAREHLSIGIAGVTVNLVVGLLLFGITNQRAFGFVFIFSFLAAQISLYFMKKIPDVPVEKEEKEEFKPGWREIVFYKPFFKLLCYSLVVQFALGSSGSFFVVVFRDVFKLSDSKIMLITSIITLFAMGNTWFFGRLIDRVGSRPMLAISGITYVIYYILWVLIIAGILPFGWPMILVQLFGGSLGGSLFGLGTTRLLMGTVPEKGGSHYFAYFSVINSLILGIAPICWGLVLDYLHNWTWTGHGWHFNAFSILYATTCCTIVGSLFFQKGLSEPKAMETGAFLNELLWHTPRKVLSQLFFKRPLQG